MVERVTFENFDHYIDRAIREAMEEGKFDNLPGTGQPLKLDDNPYIDHATELSNHLLRSNGFSPAWIEERKEIETEVTSAQADLERTRRWLDGVGLAPSSSSEWARACAQFRERAAVLNRRIRDLNLKAPDVLVHLRLLDVEAIIKSVAG